MNNCVSDHKVVVNIQGIRYVTWGEADSVYSNRPGERYYVAVTYKGNTFSFKYKTQEEAQSLFSKIREAMDKKWDPIVGDQ